MTEKAPVGVTTTQLGEFKALVNEPQDTTDALVAAVRVAVKRREGGPALAGALRAYDEAHTPPG